MRIEEAGGQPAQAAIAQRGIGLLLAHLLEVEAKLVQACGSSS